MLASTDTVNGNFTYTMDSINRIATASCTSAPCSGDAATYNIDRYGNRWSETGTLPGAAPPALSFTGNNNRIDGWTYDTNGNLLNDGTHSYAFDAENRLTAVDNGTTASYIYNAEGERVHENVGGVVEEFLNASGPQDLTIVDASQNSIETDYSFGGRPLATANSGGLYFAATDNLGTVRARFNAAGASVETDTSWPYGEFRNYANSISRLHFTGKLDDTESGLDYLGARYYSPTLGRFMTPDWSATPEAVPYADVKDPQSLNLYAYVTNGPTTAIDPDGHWCIFGFGTTCTKAQKLPVKEGDGAPAWHWCQGGNAKCDKNGNVIPDSGAIYQDNGMLGLMVGGIGGFFARDAATAGAGGAVTAGVRAAARPMVSIVEVDQGVTEYSVAGANGEIRVLAEVTKEGDTLVLRGTSVQGAGSGTSSVTELRQRAKSALRLA